MSRDATEQDGVRAPVARIEAQEAKNDELGIPKRSTLELQQIRMKFIIDLFPIVAFFAAYKMGDMYLATEVVMIACFFQTVGYRLFGGKFDKNHLLALGLVLPFGAATLIFRDPAFIKWNGTVGTWLLGAAFLVSQFVGEMPIVQRMMGSSFEIPDARWRQLNLSWVLFFLVTGACNIIVAYRCEEETWVNFRMFGLTGMSLVFIVAQMAWLMRFLDAQDGGERDQGGDGDLG